MIANNPAILAIISAVVSALISALLTMILMHLKGTRQKIDEQQAALSDLEKTLPLDYVLRDDFIRWTIRLDKKFDDLSQRIEENSHDRK